MASIAQILETVDSVMSKVNAVAQLPGVNLIPYVSTISGIISTVHSVYQAGKDVTPFISEIKKTFDTPGTPSQEDVDALHAKIKDLEAQIDEPLPEKDPDEPE